MLEKICVRLLPTLNDWLDMVVKETRRRSGNKIYKEKLVETAIYLLKNTVDWTRVSTEETLEQEVEKIINLKGESN